jgi:hypothetical protein
MPPGDDLAYRRAVFGSGRGLLTPRVDSSTKLTRIFALARIA